MNLSRRETTIAVLTLALLLGGVTYWLSGTKISEQRRLAEEQERLLRQIQLHKRILNEQNSWTSRLEELQAQLPVYDEKISITAELMKEIKRMADKHRIDLLRTQPYREEQIGSLFELGVSCNWEGNLDGLVHFLYELNSQGLRFDVRQINITPDPNRESILKGSMIIDCAYRKRKPEIQNSKQIKNPD